MPRILCFLFLVLMIGQLSAQEQKDTIEIKKYLTSHYYLYQGKQLKTSSLYKLTLNSPAAHEEMIKARRDSSIEGYMLAAILGCLGWAAAKNTPQETTDALVYTVGGMSIISLTLSFSEKKHKKKAVHLHNHDIHSMQQ
jgi:hypothetical protein